MSCLQRIQQYRVGVIQRNLALNTFGSCVLAMPVDERSMFSSTTTIYNYHVAVWRQFKRTVSN